MPPGCEAVAVDFEQQQVMIAMIYRKGMEAGSVQQATEIRISLGLERER